MTKRDSIGSLDRGIYRVKQLLERSARLQIRGRTSGRQDNLVESWKVFLDWLIRLEEISDFSFYLRNTKLSAFKRNPEERV